MMHRRDEAEPPLIYFRVPELLIRLAALSVIPCAKDGFLGVSFAEKPNMFLVLMY